MKFVLCISHCFILHGISGQQCSTFSGCHVTEAAVFYSIWEQPKKWTGITICLLPAPLPLQILSLKLAEWIAKNLAEELNLPDTGDEWSSEDLNSTLTCCLVSDQWGNNLHTFHTVEFEYDCISLSCWCCVIRLTWPSTTFLVVAKTWRCVNCNCIYINSQLQLGKLELSFQCNAKNITY